MVLPSQASRPLRAPTLGVQMSTRKAMMSSTPRALLLSHSLMIPSSPTTLPKSISVLKVTRCASTTSTRRARQSPRRSSSPVPSTRWDLTGLRSLLASATNSPARSSRLKTVLTHPIWKSHPTRPRPGLVMISPFSKLFNKELAT